MRLSIFLYVCVYALSSLFLLYQGLAPSLKGQIANTFGSVGSYSMLALWPQSNHSQYVNEYDCISIKFYLQKQEVGWIWPVACSLP